MKETRCRRESRFARVDCEAAFLRRSSFIFSSFILSAKLAFIFFLGFSRISSCLDMTLKTVVSLILFPDSPEEASGVRRLLNTFATYFSKY
mgnify:CR=1 FL=1